jgi:hypothetical protein
MGKLGIFVSIWIFTALLAGGAAAQKRTPSRTPSTRTTPAKNTSTLPPLDVRAARVKVSNQESNVAQFVSIMGPITQSIEALDNESKTRKISPASADANASNKQKLLTAIKNMRAGIDSLETEFQTKPALKLYLPRIQGISDLAAQSENMAVSGKYVSSRDPWKTILQKLNDTLAAMPNAEL